MKSKKHIVSFKNFKKYRDRYLNMKIKGWLDGFLPNVDKPDPPINPDGTVPGR